MTQRTAIRRLAAAATPVAVAALVFVVMGSGCIEEISDLFGGNSGGQHWTQSEGDTELEMAWGIKPSSPAAIYIEGEGSFNPPIDIWVSGRLVVNNAGTANDATVRVYISKVGASYPVGSGTDTTKTVTMSSTATAGQFAGNVDHEFTSLGYDQLGLSQVGAEVDIECYVEVDVTVDGAVKTLNSRSSVAGYKMHLKRTSDAALSFNWQAMDPY